MIIYLEKTLLKFEDGDTCNITYACVYACTYMQDLQNLIKKRYKIKETCFQDSAWSSGPHKQAAEVL